VKDLLPEDGSAAGFDKTSSALEISATHLLRYQDAAERMLQKVVPRSKPAAFKQRKTGKELAEGSQQFAMTVGSCSRIDGDEVIVHVRPHAHIVLPSPSVPRPGRYRVRASMYARGTDGKPLAVRWLHAQHYGGKGYGKSEKVTRAVRDVPADKPAVLEGEFEMERSGEALDFTGWTLPAQRGFEEAWKGKLDKYTGPGLVIQWVEVEAIDMDEFPSAGFKRLFGDLPLKPQYTNGPLRVESAAPKSDAARLMRDFLPIAFRRPVNKSQEEYFIKIVHDALDQKKPFEDAMLLGYRAVFCSPNFLLLAEPISGTAKLDDHAIASRLSYFLWSTTPDAELLRLAEKRELSKPAVLREQVERMLKDRRASRFTENFTGQWLDLRKMDATFPDPNVYGEFDDYLFWSMPRETTMFFDEVLRNDRSVAEFVHSDWSVLNERLAKHYGISGVAGGELRMVKLPANAHRGGLLTHASILKITADGTKTSPILRGKWVLERILGLPPAPPPPNISAIEPDIRGATTIRQQLDKHRNIEACAACHRHIDPPGFALESFDVIGGWREFYRATAYKREAIVPLPNYPGRQVIRGLDVEIGGKTQDGREFKNIDDYKQILLSDKDRLARNVAQKLIVYATGADIQFADREVIEQLVKQSREKSYGLRSLLHDVVQSRVFLNK
jgi:hypothetical protein